MIRVHMVQHLLVEWDRSSERVAEVLILDALKLEGLDAVVDRDGERSCHSFEVP